MLNFFRKLLQPKKNPAYNDRALYDLVTARYQIKPAHTLTPLVHRPIQMMGTAYEPRININLRRSITQCVIGLRAVTQNTSLVSPRQTAVTLESLLQGSRALEHLVGALWKVYRSNNVNLRQSFVGLVSHIHSERPNNARIVQPLFVQHREQTLNRPVSLLVYASPAASEKIAPGGFSSREIERLIEEKLKTAGHTQSTPMAAEPDGIYKIIQDRLTREQQTQWRYEKLQRGLF